MPENPQTDASASINGRIRQFVVDRFPQARQAELSDEQDLLQSGIVDSLGILELVNFLTEEFRITVSDEELLPEHFSSIRSLTEFVESKQTGI